MTGDRTVIVAGAVANKPLNGGEAWVRLSWVLGLNRLGFDVWLLEQLVPESCRAVDGGAVLPDASLNVGWFEKVTNRFGLLDRASLMLPDGRVLSGAPLDAVTEAAAAADLMVNISGNVTLESVLRLPRRRAYLDLDPGYTQFWDQAGALGPVLDRHDHLLTVGLGIGRSSGRVPTDGRRWRAVPPPVVLEEWPLVDPAGAAKFTTVASWRGGYGRVAHRGRLFGQKAHEFRRFVDLPNRTSASFEVALDIHPDDDRDRQFLETNGWRLVDPHAVAGDPDAFREYVQHSPAEFSPTQGIYAETACGWFSDRTTRYLASGRPAVIQDTQLPPEIPLGEGLFAFGTIDEAQAAVTEVTEDYPRHARSARRLAEECFDSDKVLGALLEDVLP